MPGHTPIIECRNLSVSYETGAGLFEVLRDLNLSVMPGESVGIVGESGCGKSTIAFAIMRYLGRRGKVTSGQVLFDGQDIAGLGADGLRHIRGNKIAMVYQEPTSSLNPSLRIKDQLIEVLTHHENVSEDEAYPQALQMLDDVHIADPARVMDAYPHQISGGQQQRCVIAMALLAKPDLLILDEPTTALDATVEADITAMIREQAKARGMAIIFISHNLGLIYEMCSRIVVMYAGEVVEEGDIAAVSEQMRHPYTRALLAAIPRANTNRHNRPLVPIRGHLPSMAESLQGCRYAPRCDYVKSNSCERVDISLTSLQGSGAHAHRVRCARAGTIEWLDHDSPETGLMEKTSGEELFRVEHLQKQFPKNDNVLGALFNGGNVQVVHAIEDISFVAHEGETIAVVGESGCGKSTLGNILMGFEAATSGKVHFNDADLRRTQVDTHELGLRQKIQMIFQNPFDALNPSFSVGRQIARVVRKFSGERDKGKIQARVLELLDQVKLPREILRRKPHQLSGGQKQRIGIVRAFAGKPSLVIADEPTSALDVSVQAAIIELLIDIQRTHGTTLLFISHDLSVVRYIADRVIVMYLGHIVEQGTMEQVFAPPYHPYTEALLSAVPVADTAYEKRQIVLNGELPSAIDPPSGCPFQTRCHRKIGDICEREKPAEKELANGHVMRCHLDQDELDNALTTAS